MQRRVRVAALASGDRLRPTLDLLPPQMLLFSSDFPHQEGRGDSEQIFVSQMEGIPQATRDRFFGGSIAELLQL